MISGFPSSATHFRHKLFANAFEALAFAKSLSNGMRAAERRCDILKDVPYAPDAKKAHRLDIFRPAGLSSPRPAILYIHGGGFTMCSKDTHHGIGLAYAGNGYVVFNINYRLAPKYKYPSALEDAALAYRWVVDNARKYGGDPSRLIVGGESAGGNLTLALTVAACFKRPEAAARMVWDTGVTPRLILALCGMLQVSAPRHLIPTLPPINPFSRKLDMQIAVDVSRAYLGRGYGAISPDREMADPLLILESRANPERPLPFIYAMAGDHDILLSHTQRLEAALQYRNVPHQARYFPRQGHAFHLLGLSPQADIFWREHLTLMRRVMAGMA